jgi:hypothetical protein
VASDGIKFILNLIKICTAEYGIYGIYGIYGWSSNHQQIKE